MCYWRVKGMIMKHKSDEKSTRQSGVSRRAFLTGAGAVGALTALGGCNWMRSHS